MKTDNLPTSDLPAVHGKLPSIYFPADTEFTKDVETGTEPLINNSFVNKNSRTIFLQKVLAICLLQKTAIGMTILIYTLSDIWHYFEITLPLVIIACLFFFVPLGLMVYFDEARSQSPYNYINLVYHPLSAIFMIIAGSGIFSYVGYRYQPEFIDTFLNSWKSYVFAVLANLFYTVFSLDTKHEIKLGNNILIATVVFGVSYLCTLPFLHFWFWNGPFANLYVTLILYVYHLYELYDIHAMTGRDYHVAMTPADYITGAVNLQIDYIITMIRWNKKTLVYFFGERS